MTRDLERIRRVEQGLREASLAALICALPNNVLLLTGYWPVIGISVAIVTSEGQVVLVVPEDEKDLAKHSWADAIHTFQPASLRELRASMESVRGPLAKAISGLKLEHGSAIGYEHNEASVPAPYVAVHFYGPAISELLQNAFPGANLVPASDLLKRLRAVLTPQELDRVRAACRIGREAFEEGAKLLQVGMTEPEAANAFRAPLSAHGKSLRDIARADGAMWCMSGPNSAHAYAAYARTRARTIALGDFAMLHCNSFADGYWTDITRTYCLGDLEERQQTMYEAVLAARRAVLETIRPGATGAEVDHAAREVLAGRGFGEEFKHPTGHGVGFAAISHQAQPRLHPASPDVLQTGMVCNVEPAIYIDTYGGLRHCDMVAVTATGAELLTPFQGELDELVIS